MTQEENIETVRRFVDAIGRGDLDVAASELAPRFEVDDTDIPDSDGQDSFYTWIARWNEVWETWRIEDPEFISVGEDKVLTLFRMVATGRGSGIELTRDDASITEFRDGKVTKVGYYNDQQQARRAAGLEG
ncbi:MAG: SnoaL-like domain [Solirubrobacterales bacterium]|nr:SnoaL-like domain [Solirubrobacterales bacterium]